MAVENPGTGDTVYNALFQACEMVDQMLESINYISTDGEAADVDADQQSGNAFQEAFDERGEGVYVQTPDGRVVCASDADGTWAISQATNLSQTFAANAIKLGDVTKMMQMEAKNSKTANPG